MKFTNKQIEVTKSNVLRQVLKAMVPQIQKGIDSCVKQEEVMTGRPVTEFSKECIEAHLLFDLYKSVVSYTKDNDQVKQFTSSYSLKGNFEIYGIIVRDEVEYGFRTEAIIADGMINRRHVRYITKTNLPNARNMNEADKIKVIIKGNNKKQRMLNEVERLKKLKAESILDVKRMTGYKKQDWVDQIEHGLLTNNWESFTKEDQKNGAYWTNEDEYKRWLADTNEATIERKMKRLDWAYQRVSNLKGSISAAQKKLDKLG